MGGEHWHLRVCPRATLTLAFLKSPCAVDDRWTIQLHLSVRDRLVNRVTGVFISPFTGFLIIYFISIKHVDQNGITNSHIRSVLIYETIGLAGFQAGRGSKEIFNITHFLVRLFTRPNLFCIGIFRKVGGLVT